MTSNRYGSSVTDIKKPFKVEDFLEEKYFNQIKDYFLNHPDKVNVPKSYYLSKKITSYTDDVLKKMHIDLLDTVRKAFDNPDIVPSYAIFAEYDGDGDVTPHCDEGPCAFSIDLCLYENSDWPMVIDEEEFHLKENDALFFHGSYHKHSRLNLSNKDNHNGIILFHYDLPTNDFFRFPEALQKRYFPENGKDYMFKLIREFDDMGKPE